MDFFCIAKDLASLAARTGSALRSLGTRAKLVFNRRLLRIMDQGHQARQPRFANRCEPEA